jgi:glycosyltransferase involved in cell wall biosynthesis
MVASLREYYPRCQLSVILGDDGALVRRLQALADCTMLVPMPKALALIGDAGAGGPAGTGVSHRRVVLRLASTTPLIAAYLRQLAEAIRRLAPDVIHSNGFKMHLLGSWAVRPHTPVIWHVHDFVSLRPLMRQLLKLALHRCAGIITNSHSVARDLRRTLARAPAVYPVYQAVDLNHFTSGGRRLDLDQIAGMEPAATGTLRVGLVATMARWKGHEVFLRALAMLPAKQMRGYIIGGPIYRTAGSQYSLAELQRVASGLGLDGRVGFTGFIDDSAAAIRTLDVVVHASVAPEPFGLTVAEAFACGRAVIASRSGGVLEIVRENYNALGHSPGDAQELAQTLARLAADPELRRTLGAAARQTAEDLFTRERLAGDLARVYEAVTPSRIEACSRLDVEQGTIN